MNLISEALKNVPGNWTKGSFTDRDGNHCGLGHIHAVVDFSNDGAFQKLTKATIAMHRVAEEQYPDRTEGEGGGFIFFNDHPDTTEADVIMVMEKAAVRLDEQV